MQLQCVGAMDGASRCSAERCRVIKPLGVGRVSAQRGKFVDIEF